METPPHDTNTLRRTTRSALAEIPTRLGSLRVTDTNAITPANHRHHNNNNTNIAVYGDMLARLSDAHLNLPSSYISPSPSPDELVIIQRGRRRMPVSWSPDIDCRKRENNTLSRERTPVKQPSPSKSTIVLRSTPRKRLLLNDPVETTTSPDKNKKLNSPNAKKCRVERPGTASGPLETSLRGLSNEQLISVIQSIIKNHTELEKEVKEMLPKPDLRPLEEQLNYLKKNIFKSLPTSRLTSKTDSPAYSRAATHVLSFKKCVLDQGHVLLDSQQWDSVVEYVILAWSYVRATPLWDNPPHNAARRQCFKSLAAQCMFALKKAELTPEMCNELYAKIEGFVVDSEEIQSCLKFLDSLRKKC